MQARLRAGPAPAPFPLSLWPHTEGTFRIADVNDAGCNFAGLTREQMVGSTIERFHCNHARGRRDMTRALNGDEAVLRELPQVMPSGEVRDLKVVYVGRGPNEVLTFV